MQCFRKACYGQASKLALPELTGQQSGARFAARGGGSRQHKQLLPSAPFLLPASGVSLNHTPGERKTKPKNVIKQKRKSGDARGIQPIIPERAALLGTDLNHVSKDLPVE